MATTTALVPSRSLVLDIKALFGVNSVTTPVGQYRKAYTTQTNTESFKLVMEAGELYTSNPIHTFSTLLVVGSGLTVTTTDANGITNTIPVTHMCFVDYPMLRFTITNNNASSTMVDVFTMPTALSATTVAYYGVADIPATLTPAFVIGLGNKFTGTKNQTFQVTPVGTKYIWFACIGASKFITNNWEGGYQVAGNVTINGIIFTVYRSDWPGLSVTKTTVGDV